jgi:hypothetical protein
MADGDRDNAAAHARRVRLRARRIDRMERFQQRQAAYRDYVNVGEVVMWAAGVPGGFTSRQVGYDFITSDLLAARIKRLLCLHRDQLIGLTPKRMQELLEMVVTGGLSPESIRDEYLDRAWMQQADFEGWRARYNLPEPPAHFRPPSPEELIIEEATERLALAYQRNPRLTNPAADRLLADLPLTVRQRKDIRLKARGGPGRSGAPPKALKS